MANTWFSALKTPVYVKVFLQGPYAGSGTMNHTLQTNGLIPASQPYSVLHGVTQVLNLFPVFLPGLWIGF